MKRTLLAVVALAVLLSGCASRAAFIYTSSEKLANCPEKPLALKVAVMPFEDVRGQKNTNAFLLGLIPFMPFGTITYERPDAANGFMYHGAYNFRPADDYAKATVEELKQNKFFDEVFFSQREKEPGIDLVMNGKIIVTSYDAKNFSYMVGPYGAYLWLLGLPASSTNNNIDINLTLKRATDGVELWHHKIKKDWHMVGGIYYNWGSDFDGYPLMMQEGLHEGMESLLKQIKEKDISYWKGTEVTKQ
jgi:hypothetical protein